MSKVVVPNKSNQSKAPAPMNGYCYLVSGFEFVVFLVMVQYIHGMS